jgi:hypothetical protein
VRPLHELQCRHGNRACGGAGKGYIAFMLPDEQTSPEQIAVFRAMTGVRRLRLAEQLYWSARKIKASGLRQQHPDWPASRVNDEVRRIFSHART